ncbi:hypothetical protein D3C84_941890 [compost metagenome]
MGAIDIHLHRQWQQDQAFVVRLELLLDLGDLRQLALQVGLQVVRYAILLVGVQPAVLAQHHAFGAFVEQAVLGVGPQFNRGFTQEEALVVDLLELAQQLAIDKQVPGIALAFGEAEHWRQGIDEHPCQHYAKEDAVDLARRIHDRVHGRLLELKVQKG